MDAQQQFINSITREEVQDFVRSHENSDVGALLLKQKSVVGIPTSWIAQQILGRAKAKAKLPTWYNTRGIIFPPSLNLEQSSSEVTAKFKRDSINHLSEIKSGIDLTGGFGVDAFFLGQMRSLQYVEPDLHLLKIVEHNHQLLGAKGFAYHNLTAEAFLTETRQSVDFIFIDPSRRKNSQKVYRLNDCSPDITQLQDRMFELAPMILVKTSPLYDVAQGCRELKHVQQVSVVAVENECKELIFLMQRGCMSEPVIQCHDIYPRQNRTNTILFTQRQEQQSTCSYSDAKMYLYEPNAAILKGGAFKWLAEHYQLDKLAPNTHLYTSDRLIDFPGRVFRVVESVKLDKTLKTRLSTNQVNILIRNYPLSVEEVKKKTGLTEGGEGYLICTQGISQKITLIAERVVRV